jgi:hypothetical protein
MPVSVSIKGKPGPAEAVAPARRLPERKESAPVPVRRKQTTKKKKRVKLADPLLRLENKARRLIARGATRWGDAELKASCSIRDSVLKLLADRPYARRKAEGFLRDLGKINTLVRERISQKERGTGKQNDHPDRNRITDFGSASGSITWGTKRRRVG